MCGDVPCEVDEQGVARGGEEDDHDLRNVFEGDERDVEGFGGN